MKRYFMIIFMTIIAVVLCICFVDKNDSNLVSSNIEDSITYGVEDIPQDLSTVSGLNNYDTDIICATSRGLVCKNEKNEIVPSLSSEYTVSKDEIQYEFKIRDDIYWSDNSKITPEDIKEYFRQLIKEEKEENITSLLNVYGAESYKSGKSSFDKGVAIKAEGDSVIIRLNKKDDKFLEELTKPQYRIRKYLVLWNDIKKNYNSIIYSGDYKIESASDSSIVLRKNNDSEAAMQAVNIIRDSSTEQSMAAYEVGERDIVINPPSSELNKLNEEKKLITMPKSLGTYLIINNNNGSIPMDGRRKLYNYVYNAIEEYQSTNSSEFDIAEGCYFRENKDNLNVIQARKVNSNKASSWSAPEVLTIIADDNKINRTLCRAIKDWFSENTNVTVKYNLASDDEFNDYELTKKYDMILINNEAEYHNKE
ncbi:MAG: ABC transporter substrate-binding protein, partial [Clostridium sp.]|nr:ABC transporter substrate-binding protein [Clostridium sp.]